jgi:Leucine-rich repeat (LRR) protein
MTHRFARTLTALALAIPALLLAACGPEARPAAVTELTIRSDGEQLLADEMIPLTVGDTLQLDAVVNGRGNFDASVTWSSDDPAVAAVSSSGLVTAMRAGMANVSAASTGTPAVTGRVTLSVTEAEPAAPDPLAACSDPEEVVTFADAAVEAAVRQLYGLEADSTLTAAPPLLCGLIQQPLESRTDESGLETGNALMLNRCDEAAIPVSSLQGLQHLVNLTRLELGCNELADISELAALINLKELNLDFNLIEDLTPLAGLTKLEVLGLYQNRVSDVAPLAGLTQLRILYASENRITDLAPLAALQALEHLWLYLNCEVTEFNFVSEPEDELRLVSRSGCLQELGPLASLGRLESLVLALNHVTDLAAVSSLDRLQLLHASGNRITDLEPLRTLPSLLTLNLDTNRISNLAPLAGNASFPQGSETFSFERGTVRMPPRADQPFPHLNLHENCLDTDDPATRAAYETLTARGTVEGFEIAQDQPYQCRATGAAGQGQQLAPAGMNQPDATPRLDETLRELRLARQASSR